MTGARGAVILSKSEMTAMEMVRTILALTDRAGQLMRELTDLCGSCEGCTEGHCTFRDADIEELIRPLSPFPIGPERKRTSRPTPSWTAMWTRAPV